MLEEHLDNIPKLKSLAVLAFAEGPEALFEFFYQFVSLHLEFWDFDFETFTLKVKPFHCEWQSIPLLISEPQLLFSDELNKEQKTMFREILHGGVEFIMKRAINDYLKGNNKKIKE